MIRYRQRAILLCLVISLGFFLDLAIADASSGLVGYWRFDEGAGTVSNDSSGNNDGTVVGSIAYSTSTLPTIDALNTSSLFFDGATGAGVQVSDDASLDMTTEMTGMAWIRWDGTTAAKGILGKADQEGGSTPNYLLGISNAGKLTFWNGTFYVESTDSITANQWTLASFILDPNGVSFYINGTISGTHNLFSQGFGPVSNHWLLIGREEAGADSFDGYIDDVRIYNRKLTATEIGSIADGEAGPGVLAINSVSPSREATGVSTVGNLTMTFSTSTVATSTGSITIRKTSDDSLAESISVTGALLSKSGATITVNPSVTLDANTEYYVSIPDTAFTDDSGAFYGGTTASTTWSFTTGAAADATAPVISNIATTTATTTAAITWDTDENSSSRVVYGPTSSYGLSTVEADTSPRVTAHEVNLTDLLSCTTYNFAVVSTDSASNTATSSDSTFTTAGCTSGTTPNSVSSEAITTSAGGDTSIVDDAKTFTVTAPADATATSSSFVIQVKAMSSTDILASIGRPAAASEEVGSTVFDIKAIYDGDTILDTFSEAITIQYEYDDDEVSGLDESSLALYHYTDGEWVKLNACSLNTTTNTISCTTTSFSIFGLFGSEAAAAQAQEEDNDSDAVRRTVKKKSEPSESTGVCTPYVKNYIRYGGENSAEDVRKLETFLNEKQGEKLNVDGIYSVEDVEAVKRFQQKYASEVLHVWGLSEPTGYVYRTTLMKINSFYCSASIKCPAFTEHNSLTENSVSTEVEMTKTLLGELGFYTGIINNAFDLSLQIALKNFQETFSDTMLKPWGLSYGTGYKYKTTNKFLNMIVGCETGSVELDGKGSFDY